MKRGRDFLDRLRADGGRLPIPESLKPEWICLLYTSFRGPER